MIGVLVFGVAACGSDDGGSPTSVVVVEEGGGGSATSTSAAPETTASTTTAPPTTPPPTTAPTTTAPPTTAPPTTAPPTTVDVQAEADALMAQWNDLNLRCRGGSGDDPATLAACDERQALYPRIVALGWCHGRDGEFGYEEQWHRCGPGSYRG